MKKIIVLLFCLIAVFALVSCDNGAAPELSADDYENRFINDYGLIGGDVTEGFPDRIVEDEIKKRGG